MRETHKTLSQNNMNNQFNFENFNSQVAQELSFDVYNDGVENGVSHDDGFMHVSFNGTRYSFDIGQDVSASVYNREANRLLREIGVVGNVTGINN